MSTHLHYAGIGSRQTPIDVQRRMVNLGALLHDMGWTLRTGCAPGADQAFARGAASGQWFLPWPSFESAFVQPFADSGSDRLAIFPSPQREAFAIAEQFHPRFNSCSIGARALHARNTHQILGPDVTDPVLSKFVVCWTPKPFTSGGTGQALRIAKHYGVPVFDLADEGVTRRIESFLR